MSDVAFQFHTAPPNGGPSCLFNNLIFSGGERGSASWPLGDRRPCSAPVVTKRDSHTKADPFRHRDRSSCMTLIADLTSLSTMLAGSLEKADSTTTFSDMQGTRDGADLLIDIENGFRWDYCHRVASRLAQLHQFWELKLCLFLCFLVFI